MAPSLVTCPTMMTAVPLCLAKRTSAAVHSRSCCAEPGLDSAALGVHGLDRIDQQQRRALLLAKARIDSSELSLTSLK